MNCLVRLSTRADRQKPPELVAAQAASAARDPVVQKRGANMVSRCGRETRFSYTCFFRGAKDETGGRGHGAASESHVQKLRRTGPVETVAVSEEPVVAKEIKQYMTIEQVKKEHERKRQAELAKRVLTAPNQVQPQSAGG